MPKIINEFAVASPLGEALKGFAGSFGGNTAQTELYRQKAFGLHRDNSAYSVLQDAERAGGYDPNNPEVRAAIVGMDKPTEFFQAQRGISATRYGAADPRATNAYVGAGGSYSGTVAGTRESEANRRGIEDRRTQRLYDAERFKVDNTPEIVLRDGVPTIARRSEAFGQQPVLPIGQVQGNILQQDIPTLSPEQRAAAGGYAPKADNPTLMNYVAPNGARGVTADGRTDRQSGVALPPSTQVFKVQGTALSEAGRMTPDSTDSRKFRQSLTANEGVVDLADRILGIVDKDPTTVGPTGNLRRFSQNTVDTLNNVGLMFGDPQRFAGAISSAQTEALSKGIDPKMLPGLFDANASNVVKMNTLLLYQAAAAIAGQSGRDISDKDIANLRNITGDPSSWLEGSQQYKSGIRLIREIASRNRDSARRVLETGDVQAGRPDAAPGASVRTQMKQKYGLE